MTLSSRPKGPLWCGAAHSHARHIPALAQVLRQRAHVSALTALQINIHFGPFAARKASIRSFLITTRRALRSTSIPCRASLYSGWPFCLMAEIHGGYLLYLSAKASRACCHAGLVNFNSSFFQNLTFCIAASGGTTQHKGALVGLVCIQQILGKLGSLAKTEGQHAGRQRIQATRMACLGSKVQSLGLCRAWLELTPDGLSSTRMPSTGRPARRLATVYAPLALVAQPIRGRHRSTAGSNLPCPGHDRHWNQSKTQLRHTAHTAVPGQLAAQETRGRFRASVHSAASSLDHCPATYRNTCAWPGRDSHLHR